MVTILCFEADSSKYSDIGIYNLYVFFQFVERAAVNFPWSSGYVHAQLILRLDYFILELFHIRELPIAQKNQRSLKV